MDKQDWLKAALIITVNLLLVSSIIVYFVWIFPVCYKWLSIKACLSAILSCFLWINIVFNYFATMLTSPGKALTVEEIQYEGYSTKDLELCRKCQRLKFLGTSHCKVCCICVRLMSTHSQITNNCVGLNNYSYYYLFFLYSNLGELFMMFQLYKPAVFCYVYTAKSEGEIEKCRNTEELPLMFFIFAFSLVLFVLSSLWLAYLSMLLLVDMSSKELTAKYRNSSSVLGFGMAVCKRVWKRRYKRHRIQHLLWERKLYWINYLIPSFNEPPMDLSAEDVIDYDEESSQMI